MRYTYHLIRLGTRLSNKYAQPQELKEIIENAASYGITSQNGIMNFPAQLKQDNANLAINVSIKDKILGGYDIKVSEPTVDPPEFYRNYAGLPDQIKNYLDKNINGFPNIKDGTVALNYSGK